MGLALARSRGRALSAAVALREAREAGLVLSVSSSGGLSYRGPRDAFERMAPALRAERDGIIEILSGKLSPPPPAPLTDEEKRAAVQALLDEMAREYERRRDWWRRPVAGWRNGKLTLRNIARDEEETVTIRRRPRTK